MAMAKDVERQQMMQMFDLLKDQPWFKARENAAHIYSTYPSVRDPFRFIMTEDEMLEAQAPPQQQPPAPGMPPQGMPMQGMGMEGFGTEGTGSGNMQADMLAGVAGGMAPQPGGMAQAPVEGGY